MSDELKQAQDQIKGLNAQLEAAKQMVNEGLNIQLQLRTNLQIFAQHNQEVAQENHQLRTTVDTLNKKILELTGDKKEALHAINP